MYGVRSYWGCGEQQGLLQVPGDGVDGGGGRGEGRGDDGGHGYHRALPSFPTLKIKSLPLHLILRRWQGPP